MRIIDKIRARETFTPTENTLAEYLQENSREVVNMSLDDLAQSLYVSKSSIIRFCKKLGYKGHKELCVQLAKELETFSFGDQDLDPSFPYEMGDDRKHIADKTYRLHYVALNETYNDLDAEALYRMAKGIHEKKNLYIYANFDTFGIAMALQAKLHSLNWHVHCISVPGETIPETYVQESESASLFLAFDTKQENFIRGVQVLNARKIPVYLISGPEKGALGKYATESVNTTYFEPLPKISAIGSLTAISLICDILYGYLFEMDYEKNMNLLKNREELHKKLNLD